MTQYYAGLDVHSRQSGFVIEDAEGRVIAQGEVPTTPAGFEHLRATYHLPAGTPVALETGTVAFFAARPLTTSGLAPVVVDAPEVRVKAYRPLQKSDRRDAFELCEGLRRGSYRAAVSAYPELRSHVAQPRAMWCCAREQVATLDTELAQQLRAAFADALRRLQTIPGVGPIVASTAIAIFSDVRRFPDAKHAASYAGLVPAAYQSGDRDAHGSITKRGAAELRAMLCEAAHHASRPAHPLHHTLHSSARGAATSWPSSPSPIVCVASCSRLLRDGRDVDLSKLAVERGPFEHKVVRLSRRKRTTVASREANVQPPRQADTPRPALQREQDTPFMTVGLEPGRWGLLPAGKHGAIVTPHG